MKIFQGSSLKVIDHSRKIFQLYDPLSLSSTFEHSFDLITRENFAARVAKMLIVVAKITPKSFEKKGKENNIDISAGGRSKTGNETSEKEGRKKRNGKYLTKISMQL